MPNHTPKKKETASTFAQIRQPDAEESALIAEFNREFLKVHYEPEHEDGVTCWCGPESKVVRGKLYINHKEQRVILRRLFVEFLLKYSNLIAEREGKL